MGEMCKICGTVLSESGAHNCTGYKKPEPLKTPKATKSRLKDYLPPQYTMIPPYDPARAVTSVYIYWKSVLPGNSSTIDPRTPYQISDGIGFNIEETAETIIFGHISANQLTVLAKRDLRGIGLAFKPPTASY